MISKLLRRTSAVVRREADLAVDHLYLAELKARGVVVEPDVRVYGRPNVQLLDGAIWIRRGALIRSRDRGYHGPIAPVRLLVDAPGAVIEIGARARINGAAIHAQRSVTIGADTYIAAGTVIADVNGHAVDATSRVAGARDTAEAVSIGSRVWIGFGVIVLKGVSIGDDVVVGAGAVVARSLPPRTLCVGQPARPVRELKT